MEAFGLTAGRAQRRMKEILCFREFVRLVRKLRKNLHQEVEMAAYLLLLRFVLSRVIPHAPVVELYGCHRQLALLWRQAPVAPKCWRLWRL